MDLVENDRYIEIRVYSAKGELIFTVDKRFDFNAAFSARNFIAKSDWRIILPDAKIMLAYVQHNAVLEYVDDIFREKGNRHALIESAKKKLTAEEYEAITSK